MPILPSPAIDWTNLEDTIFGLLFSCRCHTGGISDVTLAFEDAQVILPFSREETDDTDDTDDIYDTKDTYDTDYTDDTADKDFKDNTDHTDDTE